MFGFGFWFAYIGCHLNLMASLFSYFNMTNLMKKLNSIRKHNFTLNQKEERHLVIFVSLLQSNM